MLFILAKVFFKNCRQNCKGQYKPMEQCTLKSVNNEKKSAARFCHQVEARVPDMFYLVKTHKIANNSATTEAEKNKHRFGISRI